MAFNDIRSMELEDGTSLPFGHGEFAVGRPLVETIDTDGDRIINVWLRVDCFKKGQGTGVLKLLVTCRNGPFGTISIPWRKGRPLSNAYTSDSFKRYSRPTSIKFVHTKNTDDEDTAYILVSFQGDTEERTIKYEVESAVAAISLPDCVITGEKIDMSSLTPTVMSEQQALPLLTPEIDYGNSRPQAGHAGRIFFQKLNQE